jgi:hypothetical protein
MTPEELRATFERLDEEYLKFKSVENRPTNRPDLCAFIVLDRLVPSERGNDIVAAADHDEIWLATDIQKLAEVASEEDILLLVRCGVRYDGGNDCLAMFV